MPNVFGWRISFVRASEMRFFLLFAENTSGIVIANRLLRPCGKENWEIYCVPLRCNEFSYRVIETTVDTQPIDRDKGKRTEEKSGKKAKQSRQHQQQSYAMQLMLHCASDSISLTIPQTCHGMLISWFQSEPSLLSLHQPSQWENHVLPLFVNLNISCHWCLCFCVCFSSIERCRWCVYRKIDFP